MHGELELGILYRTHRINDGGRIHPKLGKESEQKTEITVLRRERTEEDAEAKREGGEQEDDHRHKQDVAIRVNRRVREEGVIGIDRQEKPCLDGELYEAADDIGYRYHEPRKVDFAEHAGVGRESAAGLAEAVGEILPKANAGKIKKRLRQPVGRDAGNAAEDDHVHDGGENRLDEIPQRAEDRLLVDGDDITLDHHHAEIAITPNLSEVHAEKAGVRLDDECPIAIGRRTCIELCHKSIIGYVRIKSRASFSCATLTDVG